MSDPSIVIEPTAPVSIRTRMLQGAGTAVGLTAFNFALSRVPSAPSWMILGILVVVAIGGAAGGATYFATQRMRERGGIPKTLANIASILAYALFVFGALLAALAWLPRGARP